MDDGDPIWPYRGHHAVIIEASGLVLRFTLVVFHCTVTRDVLVKIGCQELWEDYVMKCQRTGAARVMRPTKANCLLLARQWLDSKREINSIHDYLQSPL